MIASAVILQNTVDMSLAIEALITEGYLVNHRLVAVLSPLIYFCLEIVTNTPVFALDVNYFPYLGILNVTTSRMNTL
ncbi:hypothetical protein NIES2101_34590 [Calothrix sp. HK-06]|nr:hypothetical protein NIES2101_34590 [Calothrix sp. HK-06]